MKKGVLYNYDTEIQEWIRTGSVLAMAHASFIRGFYQLWAPRIKEILEEVTAIQKEYMQYDGDLIKRLDGQPVFIEGKTKEQFNLAWNALMNQEVVQPLNLVKTPIQ